GLGHGKAGTDGCRHGLLDEEDLTGSRAHRGFADGTAFDLGGAAGHAYDDPRAGSQQVLRMHHADELLEHLLGDREVGNDAILHGPNGLDVAWHAAQHHFGLVAYCLDALLAIGTTFMANGDHGWLIEDDAFAAHVNQRVSGTQVYRQVAGKITAQETKHGKLINWRWGRAAGLRQTMSEYRQAASTWLAQTEYWGYCRKTTHVVVHLSGRREPIVPEYDAR